MSKNSFILYKDYQPHIDMLSNEQAGQLFKAIFEYVEDRQEPTLDPITKMAFSFIKSNLERDLIKYKSTVERNRENGLKGGRPKNKPLMTTTGKTVPKDTQQHFTYLLYDKVRNIYKIGETQNLIKRRYDLRQPTNDIDVYDFVLSTVIKCQKLENEIIKSFDYCRVSGDWFNFSKEDITTIIGMFNKASGYPKNPTIAKKADSGTDSVIDTESDIVNVIKYLNKKVGSNYKHTTQKTKTIIKARYNEGFTYEDFVKAIDNAHAHWTKSGEFGNMKPSTLFNGKFESRVNGESYNWVEAEDVMSNIKFD